MGRKISEQVGNKFGQKRKYTLPLCCCGAE
jgi:hypothetical protein